MKTQLDTTAQTLREQLLSGRFGAEGKLREQMLAEAMGVSRTVIRLALGELEKEGLVTREPNKGYRIRSFTLEEVTDAILVRGELEGMAVRLCAEQGLSAQQYAELDTTLMQLDQLLKTGINDQSGRIEWVELNSKFHTALIIASGNVSLSATVASLSRMPLVSARAIVFDTQDDGTDHTRLAAAQFDHHAVLGAIRARQGGRAEHVIREHARKSAENKRISFDAMRAGDHGPGLVGLALVSG